MLDRGANIGAVPKDGKTALRCSLELGRTVAAQLLHDRRVANIEAAAGGSEPALYYSAEQIFGKDLQLLLGRGGNIDTGNAGSTQLFSVGLEI